MSLESPEGLLQEATAPTLLELQDNILQTRSRLEGARDHLHTASTRTCADRLIVDE